MRRAAPALLAALAVLAVATAPAQADRVLLEAADAQDLAEQLADAREATGVCFAWEARVNALDGSPGGTDAGSDRGPDTPATGCTRSLTLLADVTYTSELSEAEDAAGIDVLAEGLPDPPTADLEALAGADAGDLLGEEDDKALFTLVAALPLLAAQVDPAIAPRLPELESGGAPADAEVADQGGSDWLRANGTTVGFGAVLALIALWLLVSGLRGLRGRRAARPPAPPRPRRT